MMMEDSDILTLGWGCENSGSAHLWNPGGAANANGDHSEEQFITFEVSTPTNHQDNQEYVTLEVAKERDRQYYNQSVTTNDKAMDWDILRLEDPRPISGTLPIPVTAPPPQPPSTLSYQEWSMRSVVLEDYTASSQAPQLTQLPPPAPPTPSIYAATISAVPVLSVASSLPGLASFSQIQQQPPQQHPQYSCQTIQSARNVLSSSVSSSVASPVLTSPLAATVSAAASVPSLFDATVQPAVGYQQHQTVGGSASPVGATLLTGTTSLPPNAVLQQLNSNNSPAGHLQPISPVNGVVQPSATGGITSFYTADILGANNDSLKQQQVNNNNTSTSIRGNCVLLSANANGSVTPSNHEQLSPILSGVLNGGGLVNAANGILKPQPQHHVLTQHHASPDSDGSLGQIMLIGGDAVHGQQQLFPVQQQDQEQQQHQQHGQQRPAKASQRRGGRHHKSGKGGARDGTSGEDEIEYDPEVIANAHLILEDEQYTCSVCRMRFKQPGNARRHIITVHRNEKPHICMKCDARFGRKDKLKTHMMRNHGYTQEDIKATFKHSGQGRQRSSILVNRNSRKSTESTCSSDEADNNPRNGFLNRNKNKMTGLVKKKI